MSQDYVAGESISWEPVLLDLGHFFFNGRYVCMCVCVCVCVAAKVDVQTIFSSGERVWKCCYFIWWWQ